jgi:hypothetical protein
VEDFAISGLRMLVEKTAAEFEPALLSGATATQAVDEWARIERVACAAKLRAAARAEETGIDSEGIVADSSGIPTHAARRQTRAARKAKGKTRERFNNGSLSVTQAEAIADAVDANPAAEESLLDLAANGSTTDLLKECERVRLDALNADGSLAARQHQARYLRSWRDSLGMTRISGAFEPLVGSKIIAELERRADRMFRAQSKAKGALDTAEQRMADALADVIDNGSAVAHGTKRGPRTVVRLIVTKDAAERGYTEPGEKCETAEGTLIPMAAVDDALQNPDTKVQEVVVDGVDVQTIRTMGKYIPQRIRDALEAVGVCCSVPGCGRTKNLQIDHNQERRDGGPTTLANLGWLCPGHHRLKTRRLYDLWRDEHGNWHWEPTNRARAPDEAAG